MVDFSKFDKIIDTNGLKAEIAESEAGKANYDEVPLGTYEVAITRLELAESKKGDPMLSVWFKILGEYQNGRLIFMNQLITKGFQIHLANEFLRSLDSGLEVHFDTFGQYGSLIFDIFDKIETDKLVFELEYGEKKGYKTFKILNVFEDDKPPF